MNTRSLIGSLLSLGLCTGLCCQAAVAQEEPDSLVTLRGRVISASDGAPVAARIRFTKLPYGDDVGIFSSNPDGQYEAPVIDQRSYVFEAQADGFYPLRQQVDIRDFNRDQWISKDFSLTPLRVGQILDFDNILFEQSESILLPESYPVLDKLVAFLTENPSIVIQLEGHTEVSGSDRANRRLSDQRVSIIKNYLVNKGISRERVKTKAFGGTMPLAKEDTPEAARLNRRVEIRVLAE